MLLSLFTRKINLKLKKIGWGYNSVKTPIIRATQRGITMSINNQNKVTSAGKTTQNSQNSQSINPDDLLKGSVVNGKSQTGAVSTTNSTAPIKGTIPTKEEILAKLKKFQELANKLSDPKIDSKTVANIVTQMQGLNISNDLEKIMKDPPSNTVLREISTALRQAAATVPPNLANPDPNLVRFMYHATREREALLAWDNKINQTIDYKQDHYTPPFHFNQLL